MLAKAATLTNTDPQTAVLANAGLINEAKARPRAEAAAETQIFPTVSAKTDPAAEAEPGTEAGTAAEAETEI